MALIAGTFVVTSGLVYFAFMAAWLTFFTAVGLSRLVTIVLGLLALLIAAVNLVELLCTAGLPALYTAVLTRQGLPAWKHYAYLALYIAAYMFDDAVLVTIGVVTLGKRKLQERGGRWLKLLSGLVILTLGALLLVSPSWLGF